MDIFSKSLEGKVAVVTGAGSGIGKATAKLLARAGARVGVLTRDPEEAETTCKEIKHDGGRALALVADIAHSDQLDAAMRRLEAQWDQLDILVANAGINGVWAPLDKLTAEDWQNTLDTNLKGTFLTVKYALPLLKRHGGSVVVVASINGTRIFSNTGATAYSASKAGQVAFARMIALELARDKVRVNTVCPGAIDTQIEQNTTRRDLDGIRPKVDFPEGTVPLNQGYPGSAEQVARVIWFLASDLSDHVTGTEVYVDGAQSLLQG